MAMMEESYTSTVCSSVTSTVSRPPPMNPEATIVASAPLEAPPDAPNLESFLREYNEVRGNNVRERNGLNGLGTSMDEALRTVEAVPHAPTQKRPDGGGLQPPPFR
eukprot:CAMPEP_0181315308 /NCGR_PEP_ID=MMETSP1101-20121128/15304_1 /TAXON_ID=46948 /ORGANISM="Rhodomonas abbreviata, Strain Caron Lab Isolate" /LENGTH=105 /DNA_ID=CAMNT_0023422503 /DNA_START=51 /DNA_END=365 /DNA_ORIENTATION=+